MDQHHHHTQVLIKFPAVLGLHVKAHLRPHLIYLQSLGIVKEQVMSFRMIVLLVVQLLCATCRWVTLVP